MRQKFRTEEGERYPKLSDRSNIVVITDEAHRSQYDVFALNMRNALVATGYVLEAGSPSPAASSPRNRPEAGKKTTKLSSRV